MHDSDRPVRQPVCSPRRLAMRLYGMAFEHRPWSVFGDADKLAAFNPLKRVPTLVLDDGEVLIESFASSMRSTRVGEAAR